MADIQLGEGTPLSPEQQRKHAARQAMQNYDAALEDLTTNWDGLTTAQKTAAMRAMLIIVARAVRWLATR